MTLVTISPAMVGSMHSNLMAKNPTIYRKVPTANFELGRIPGGEFRYGMGHGDCMGTAIS